MVFLTFIITICAAPCTERSLWLQYAFNWPISVTHQKKYTILYNIIQYNTIIYKYTYIIHIYSKWQGILEGSLMLDLIQNFHNFHKQTERTAYKNYLYNIYLNIPNKVQRHRSHVTHRCSFPAGRKVFALILENRLIVDSNVGKFLHIISLLSTAFTTYLPVRLLLFNLWYT